MKLRAVSGIMLILLSALLLTSFNAPVSASGTDLIGDVEVGALFPMTGDLATFGENAKSAITLAETEINDFLEDADAGWTLKLVHEDSATDPVVSLERTESLFARGIEFIIGPMASDCVAGIKTYTDANEILVTSPSSTRPGLNTPDDFLFRFCSTDLIQGPAIARLIIDDGVTKVIGVYRDDAWGKGLHDVTKARFEALGGTFIESIAYDTGAPGFPAVVATLDTEVTDAIATYGADKVGVLYIAFEEVVQFFTECSAYSDLLTVNWYGSDGTALSAAMTADPTVAEFAYDTGFINPIFSPTRSDKWQKVTDYVNADIGRDPDSYAYIAYDIVWVLALSLLEVNAYDTGAVRAALPTVARNYFGASGWILLDDNGDRASADYDMWIIDKVDTWYEWKLVGTYVQATDSIVWGPPPPIYVFEPVWHSKIFYVVTESNSTVSDYYFNPDEGPFIMFNVTGSDGATGFCRVAIPKQLLWVEDVDWTVLVGDDPVDVTVIKEDDRYTYLYFTYSHSTKKVQIIGTHVIGGGCILKIFSSPTGVTFTVDGASRTTPCSRIYGEGASVSLVMPETHYGCVWSHWLEDGDPNRTKTVTMNTNITLTAVFEAPPTVHEVVWDGKIFAVNIESPSSVTMFAFNQSQKQISFNVTGLTGTIGFCNVTIPKQLLDGEPWMVKIGGLLVPYVGTENETHTFLYLTYTHESPLKVTIVGTWVIPEFPSPIILQLFMILSLFTVIFAKLKKKKQ